MDSDTTSRCLTHAEALGSLTALAAAAQIDRTVLHKAIGGTRGLSPRACLRLHAVVGGDLAQLVRDMGGEAAGAMLRAYDVSVPRATLPAMLEAAEVEAVGVEAAGGRA